MTESKLNKRLYDEITKLKLLEHNSQQPKFKLQKSPFNEDEDDQTNAACSGDITIEGLIYPDSEIFREGAYLIELKLIQTYPFDPPEVRFITKIYHPNVAEDGRFCHDLLKKTAKWTVSTSLVDVIKAVIGHIDKPDIDYALSIDLGRLYMENRPEFNRRALEFVKQHAVPRA